MNPLVKKLILQREGLIRITGTKLSVSNPEIRKLTPIKECTDSDSMLSVQWATMFHQTQQAWNSHSLRINILDKSANKGGRRAEKIQVISGFLPAAPAKPKTVQEKIAALIKVGKTTTIGTGMQTAEGHIYPYKLSGNNVYCSPISPPADATPGPIVVQPDQVSNQETADVLYMKQDEFRDYIMSAASAMNSLISLAKKVTYTDDNINTLVDELKEDVIESFGGSL